MKACPRLILASLLLLASYTQLSAFDIDEARARYTVTSWTEKDGLPSSHIRAIVQDGAGYLWLATYSGLVRFDGMRFVAWKTSDSASLASDYLTSLLIARDGSLWVGKYGGVTHLSDGRIVTGSSMTHELFDGYVSELLEDRHGAIWAAGSGGVARFDGKHWVRIGTEGGLPERAAQSLFQDNGGTMWVGTSAGIYFKTPSDAIFKAVAPLSDAIASVIQDAAGNIVVTHPTALIRQVRGSAQTSESPQFVRSHGTRLLLDREGSLWVGTRNQGLVRIRDDHSRGRLVDRVSRDDGLSADSVSALMQDREGNIWVGTHYGLNRLSENAIIPVPSDEGLSGFVRAVTSSADGNIWAATEESLVHFSGKSQRKYDWSRAVPDRTLIALHEDRHTGVLWISTHRGLVHLTSGRFSPFRMPGNLQLNRIRSIASDNDGRLWLCDADIGVLRSTDRTLTTFELLIPKKVASWVRAARDGRMWIGLVNGTVATYKDEKLTFFSEKDGLAGGTVTAIHEDANGTIWVGTHGGLSRFDNGRFVTLRGHDFPGTGPLAIAHDDEGYLWLGVAGLGILRVSVDEFGRATRDRSHRLQYRLYGISDGLRASPVNRFGSPSSARAANGTLWFATGNGLAVVNPGRLRGAHTPVPLIVEGIVTDNEERLPTASLSLPPNTSKLQIDYTLLSLTPRSRVQFRYKLEGLDEQWIEAGGRRQAFYTNVPPGRYRFVVEAGSGDGLSINSVADLAFSIEPRFYQTFWFALTVSVFVGFILWALWRMRVHQIQQRFALVLGERTRVGREIHDTLLQGLVGMAVQFKVISETVHSTPDLAKERLERLRKLVEQYICETRQSIWDLRSPALETNDFVTALRRAGEAITADQKVRFELLVRGKPYPCQPKVEEQLLRVGREALSNAVRHADATRLRVELIYNQDSVQLRVIDDGSGFAVCDPAFSAGTHWGLMSMRERARHINATFQITSMPGKGTELELIVPALAAK